MKISGALLALSVNLAAMPLDSGVPLDEGYRQMYNLRFPDAHRTFALYSSRNPNDPMGPVSDAAAWLFSEFDRLNILQSEFWAEDRSFLDFRKPEADETVKRQFEASLDKAARLADAELRRNPADGNSMFATTLRYGLHADYLALIEKRNFAALSEIKQGRVSAEQLLAKHPEYYDAYLAVGVENYLLSLKPAPVRWVLNMTGSQTDRQTGVAKLRLAAEKGHYLMPFARLLLAVADLRDQSPARAKERLRWLATEFPGNRLYREELAKLN